MCIYNSYKRSRCNVEPHLFMWRQTLYFKLAITHISCNVINKVTCECVNHLLHFIVQNPDEQNGPIHCVELEYRNITHTVNNNKQPVL